MVSVSDDSSRGGIVQVRTLSKGEKIGFAILLASIASLWIVGNIFVREAGGEIAPVSIGPTMLGCVVGLSIVRLWKRGRKSELGNGQNNE